MTPLRGAFIGRGRLLVACAEHWLAEGQSIQGVVSDCPEVIAWAERHGVDRASESVDQALWLGRSPFDHLFSIVNHAVTPPAILALPRRRAVNFHDSPLPRYAGFNATTWAILDGQAEHGVTWHEMSTAVDGGPILVQDRFPIGSDDTAFSLGAKCLEAGLQGFCRLCDILKHEALSGEPAPSEPQTPVQDYHRRSDRPGLGVVDLAASMESIDAFVRALDLGSDDNWMCRPKLALPSGWVLVGEATPALGAGAPAGTVMGIDSLGVAVAVGNGAIRFSRFSALDGAPLEPRDLDLKAGQVLHQPSAEHTAHARADDAALSRHERFWVNRLVGLRSPVIGDLKPHSGERDPVVVVRALPRALLQDKTARRATLVAAYTAYVARVADSTTVALALHKPWAGDLAAAYGPTAPFCVTIDPSRGFSSLRRRIERELAAQDRRGGYARDAVTRYAALRAARPAPLTVGLRFETIEGLHPEDALAAGSHLTLIVDDEGDHYAWAYDRQALSEEAAGALADRFDVLLASGLSESERPVGDLDILSAAERQRLFAMGRGEPIAGAADRCIHDLFAAQAARTPDALAITFRGESLTYRQLDQRANRVAEDLSARGVGPDALVAVCLERSLDLVVGLLGVLKAGGAYVPLDPAYPRDRLGVMLEDAQAKVILTQRRLLDRLPSHSAEALCVEDLGEGASATAPQTGVTPRNLAYVIFTSGSTGRPKGVMVQHGNVANFFAGMDATLGTEPGVWLAVTSVSFDISVLELFWTLTRGFEVVIQPESDRASLSRDRQVLASSSPMDFGLFYFAADQGSAKPGETYRLLLEGTKFADTHDFSAVWTPERHFHAFGGLYPNPAVTTAALATITSRIALRAGSVVLPLHNPLRVAEDWSVIDQLSGGRVGLSFASGWHADDFAFMPDNYERRREVMLESIDTVMKLWRGEKVEVLNGQGQPILVGVMPRPIQAAPPMWIASAGSVETFKVAGRLGANVLTNMLGQDLDDLKLKFAAYREARAAAGHAGPGVVTVMLHTFVCEDTETARDLARKPFCDYLASSFDLIKVAPTMFPAFRQPSLAAGEAAAFDAALFTDEDMAALMEHAFDRYFETAGLFGAPEKALALVETLKAIGANEVACLIDFGIDPDVVLQNLPHLDRLRRMANAASDREEDAVHDSVADQIRQRGVTHLQCTPSMARMLAGDPQSLAALSGLQRLLLGGEALPADLADQLCGVVTGEVRNLYGPTETTIWSTTTPVRTGEPISIGRPIANTVIRILDARGQLVPTGVAGELCIGGEGVVRGYLCRPDLTAERFIADPHAPGQTLYRTGDLARLDPSGDIEFLGRLDHQVKVNGYRIELGEIETVLARHPGVRQAVVTARTDDGPAQLVAYVTPAVGRSAGPVDRVAQWGELWDQAYRQAGPPGDPRFNIAGWNDSYTGAAIPAAAMREWLETVERRLLGFAPRRVLEIGCGTGMVLYRLAPHVQHYTAVDVASHALEAIRGELTADERGRITLLQQAAHTLEGVAERSCDTVVINSVAQYFPDADYLAQVIRRASVLTADGGRIFIGDVRSRDHLDAFHTLCALHQAPGDLPAAELARRIAAREAQEGELVLSEAYFHALARDLPRLSGVEVRLKPGRADNEMNAFRYDVVLHVGPSTPQTAAIPAAPGGLTTLAAIRGALADRPAVLVLRDLKNARLAGAYAVRDVLAANDGLDVDALRARLGQAAGEGVEPADLVDLDPDYDVELVWARSGDVGRFDAVMRHKTTGPRGRIDVPAPPHDLAPGRYANRPAQTGGDASALFDDLRAHVREALPDYMTPAAFVAIDRFPLTPNGKIDRGALPAPRRDVQRPALEFVAPSNALEETIAGVWKGLLNLERVGLQDNIFDLGASSLLTAQANQRLSALLGRKISLVSMFRYPTVETLAAHLGEAAAAPAQVVEQVQARADRKMDAAARRRELRGALAR